MKNEPIYREQLYRLALGRITKDERHELEMKALNDPFLFEAIEGYSAGLPTKKIDQSIKSLKKSIIVQKENVKSPFPYRKILALAATVFGLIMLSYILIPQLGKMNGESQTSLAENKKPKSVKSPVAINKTQQENTSIAAEPDSTMASLTMDEDTDTTSLTSLDLLALNETSTEANQEGEDSQTLGLIPAIPTEITQQNRSIVALQNESESREEEETDEIFTVSKKMMSRLDLSVEELKAENEMAIIATMPNFQEVPISGEEAAKLSQFIKNAMEKEKDVFQNLPATMSFILSFDKEGVLVWVEGKSACSTCNNALTVLIQDYPFHNKDKVYREKNVVFIFKSK